MAYHLDSGLGSIDRPLLGSLDNGGGSIPEMGTLPGLGTYYVDDNNGDQAYASLDDPLSSLQPESLQLLSMVVQNTSEDSTHFQDEGDNTSAGGGSPDSSATAAELSLSTTSSSSTTLQSNEDNTAAPARPPSSDSESDANPSALGLNLEGNNSLKLEATVSTTSTHEASNVSGNGAHDMNQDALPSATLSNVTAQNVRYYREIVIRGPVDEKHTEVINERVLVEPSSPPK